MIKHTSGKWHKDQVAMGYNINIHGVKKGVPFARRLARVGGEVSSYRKDDEANANLISSAPELLLAAKEACLLLKEIADTCKVSCLKSPGFLNLMEAIRKAEGR